MDKHTACGWQVRCKESHWSEENYRRFFREVVFHLDLDEFVHVVNFNVCLVKFWLHIIRRVDFV